MNKGREFIELGAGNYGTHYLVELELKAVNLGGHTSVTKTLWRRKQIQELQHVYILPAAQREGCLIRGMHCLLTGPHLIKVK